MRSALAMAVFSVFAASAGCGDGLSGGGKARLLEVDGWMLSTSFSHSGEHLIAVVSHTLEDLEHPGNLREMPDTLVVWKVGTWEKVLDHTTPGTERIWRAYTCADPDIVIHSQDRYPEDTSNDLVWRSVSNGTELATLAVDNLPWQGQWGSFYCDFEENIVYMDAFSDRVVAVDGSTGEILAEYPIDRHDLHVTFWVTKERDRIVIADGATDKLWAFRLSTGELLGSVDIWPWYRPPDLPVHAHLLDQDRLVYIIYAGNDLGTGVHLFIVDLDSITVTSERLLEGYTFSDSWVMEEGSDNLLMAVHRPPATDVELVDVDCVSGIFDHMLDLTWQGQGQTLPLPELGRVFVDDWSASGGTEARIYSYPELELLHKGKSANDSDEKEWVEDRQLIVMASYFSERFGVYNPVKHKVVDDFHVCTRACDIGGHCLRVSPDDRWASLICAGRKLDGEYQVGVNPSGAGVAVVDLDRYR